MPRSCELYGLESEPKKDTKKRRVSCSEVNVYIFAESRYRTRQNPEALVAFNDPYKEHVQIFFITKSLKGHVMVGPELTSPCENKKPSNDQH